MMWIIILAVIAVLFWFGSAGDRKKGDHLWWLAPMAGLLAAGFACYWLSPADQRRQLRKSLSKVITDPPAQGWFEFADAGFLSAGKAGRSSFHPWSTISSVVECADALVIYFEENTYYWVPQSAFGSSQDYTALIDLVAKNVAPFERRR